MFMVPLGRRVVLYTTFSSGVSMTAQRSGVRHCVSMQKGVQFLPLPPLTVPVCPVCQSKYTESRLQRVKIAASKPQKERMLRGLRIFCQHADETLPAGSRGNVVESPRLPTSLLRTFALVHSQRGLRSPRTCAESPPRSAGSDHCARTATHLQG